MIDHPPPVQYNGRQSLNLEAQDYEHHRGLRGGEWREGL